MNREDKINEGQVQLNDRNNYRPLDQPMVENTAKKANALIKSMLQEGYIDEMTAKWLSLTLNPPRIPMSYTLTKIHKPKPVGRSIISGCNGPTERLSSFVDCIIQSVPQIQESYLKDTTDFINFIERTKLPKNSTFLSMDVTSLYTNIPQEEEILTAYKGHGTFEAWVITGSTISVASTITGCRISVTLRLLQAAELLQHWVTHAPEFLYHKTSQAAKFV